MPRGFNFSYFVFFVHGLLIWMANSQCMISNDIRSRPWWSYHKNHKKNLFVLVYKRQRNHCFSPSLIFTIRPPRANNTVLCYILHTQKQGFSSNLKLLVFCCSNFIFSTVLRIARIVFSLYKSWKIHYTVYNYKNICPTNKQTNKWMKHERFFEFYLKSIKILLSIKHGCIWRL